ncbi:hypothetical protein OSJ57_25140 [Sphingomonas sp. HH69]
MAFLGLMTVREHEAVVADLKATFDEQRAHWRKSIQGERDSVVRLVGQKAKHMTGIARLQHEVEGLRADVRQAEAAHDKVSSELAHWKKHGQLRDPATGRLIPKAKPTDVFTASHSPA